MDWIFKIKLKYFAGGWQQESWDANCLQGMLAYIDENPEYQTWTWMNVYFRYLDKQGQESFGQIASYTKRSLPIAEMPTYREIARFVYRMKQFNHGKLNIYDNSAICVFALEYLPEQMGRLEQDGVDVKMHELFS